MPKEGVPSTQAVAAGLHLCLKPPAFCSARVLDHQSQPSLLWLEQLSEVSGRKLILGALCMQGRCSSTEPDLLYAGGGQYLSGRVGAMRAESFLLKRVLGSRLRKEQCMVFLDALAISG